MPATTFSAVLFPDPFLPTMPNVQPGRTANDTPLSAWNVSSGFRSLTRVPERIALLSVANCFRREYLRYVFVTSVTSMAFISDSDNVSRQ